MVWDKQPQGDDQMTDLDIQIVGLSKRLSIPLGEPLLMRQVADILRGLATQIDFNSRRPDLPERSRRMNDRFEIDCANRKIKEAAKLFGAEIKEGRPIKAKGGEQSANGTETLSLRAIK